MATPKRPVSKTKLRNLKRKSVRVSVAARIVGGLEQAGPGKNRKSSR